MFENVKTVFLDYDGTIHDSIHLYAPAFRKAYSYLVNEELAQLRIWSDAEISYWLGYNSKAMWQQFMPKLESNIRERASKIIGDEMLHLVKRGKSVLYDGALSTLLYLREKGYHLVFLSNCSSKYRDIARDTFELDNYFEDLVCSEDYAYNPKHEILKVIKNRYPEKQVMVGDRFQDIEAGKKNGILTIGCNYGYHRPNELVEADLIINSINELKTLL